MLPRDARDLKKSYKRLGWFILGVFVFAVAEAYLLWFAGVGAVLNGLLLLCR